MNSQNITETVLGISQEHDAGVALLDASTGKILFAANEERYSRKKFQDGLPKFALAQLVKAVEENAWPKPTNIAVASIFHVGNSMGDWQNLSWFWLVIENIMASIGLDRILWGSEKGASLLRIIGKFQQIYRKQKIITLLRTYNLPCDKVLFFDHHTCHAAAAAMACGWRDSLVITQDASGDGYCSKVFLSEAGQLTELQAIPFFHSPGHYYEYVTMLFGFKLGREGKVTGLAAYGNAEKTYPLFLKEMAFNPSKKRYHNFGFYRRRELQRIKKVFDGYSREDIAAGVQKHLEEMMTEYIIGVIHTYCKEKTVKLAVAGGVFANVKLNQRISQLPCISSFFVFPHMGDGGLAAGAAYAFSSQHGVVPQALTDLYLGDTLQKDEIDAALKLFAKRIKLERPKNIEKRIAQLLSWGKVVAIVTGAMEYGPRALGHRSLLYQATDPTVNTWLNKRLKRSEFMPFAPILKMEHVSKYFSGYRKVLPCILYMTITLPCTQKCHKDAPAIVHVDNTARPQLVTKNSNPFMYKILGEYERMTKKRILINTSYNIHEEPIVQNASQAIKTFIEGGLDYLVIDGLILSAKRQ